MSVLVSPPPGAVLPGDAVLSLLSLKHAPTPALPPTPAPSLQAEQMATCTPPKRSAAVAFGEEWMSAGNKENTYSSVRSKCSLQSLESHTETLLLTPCDSISKRHPDVADLDAPLAGVSPQKARQLLDRFYAVPVSQVEEKPKSSSEVLPQLPQSPPRRASSLGSASTSPSRRIKPTLVVEQEAGLSETAGQAATPASASSTFAALPPRPPSAHLLRSSSELTARLSQPDVASSSPVPPPSSPSSVSSLPRSSSTSSPRPPSGSSAAAVEALLVEHLLRARSAGHTTSVGSSTTAHGGMSVASLTNSSSQSSCSALSRSYASSASPTHASLSVGFVRSARPPLPRSSSGATPRWTAAHRANEKSCAPPLPTMMRSPRKRQGSSGSSSGSSSSIAGGTKRSVSVRIKPLDKILLKIHSITQAATTTCAYQFP